MKISCIGKLKNTSEKTLCTSYEGDIKKFGRSLGVKTFSLVEHPESREQSLKKRCEEETLRLLSAITPQESVVFFAKEGDLVSSEEIAVFFEKCFGNGVPCLHFLIGGPDGFSPCMHNKSQICWSFGRVTWPHRLFRIMLLEQLYRALTILGHHPYHRA